MENEIAVANTTFPDVASAKRASAKLVLSGLVACAQTGAPISSSYIWKGEFFSETEIPVSYKIPRRNLEAARSAFLKLHPYECPQWIVFEASASSAYAKWVDECGGDRKSCVDTPDK